MALREREHAEAVALMEWCRLHENLHPELRLIYAIPNGGIRQRGMAGKMKAEGVKRGVPDYHLPVARGGYHSLYIELKAERGYPTKEQKWWAVELSNADNKWVCCRGWEHAVAEIKAYLAGSGVHLEQTLGGAVIRRETS